MNVEAAMRISEEATKKISEIADKARSETIYGESREIGETTIIPVGRVTINFGFGGGQGKGGSGSGEEGEGEGAGAGGRVTVSPVAIIRVRESSEEVIPIVDQNQVAKFRAIVLGIVAFWVGLAVARLMKRKKV